MSPIRPFVVYEGCLMQSLAVALHLSPPLRSSAPRSCRHYHRHQIAMMRRNPWSGPHIPNPLLERESKTDAKERKSPYREEKDRLLVLSAGSEGVARTGEERETEGRGRGINGKEREMVVVMGLMCNKLHEGAFREALLSSSTHTTSKKNRHTY